MTRILGGKRKVKRGSEAGGNYRIWDSGTRGNGFSKYRP